MEIATLEQDQPNIRQGFWAAKSVSCSSKHTLQNLVIPLVLTGLQEKSKLLIQNVYRINDIVSESLSDEVVDGRKRYDR